MFSFKVSLHTCQITQRQVREPHTSNVLKKKIISDNVSRSNKGILPVLWEVSVENLRKEQHVIRLQSRSPTTSYMKYNSRQKQKIHCIQYKPMKHKSCTIGRTLYVVISQWKEACCSCSWRTSTLEWGITLAFVSRDRDNLKM